MTAHAVRIALGKTTFDHATYDDRGDVLYLHVGDRETAADSLGTPEGHTVRCNAAGDAIGVSTSAPRLSRRRWPPRPRSRVSPAPRPWSFLGGPLWVLRSSGCPLSETRAPTRRRPKP
jgi:hypothetical protein